MKETESVSVSSAAITKMPQTAAHTTDISCSQLWRLRSQGQGANKVGFILRLLLPCRWPPSHRGNSSGRGERAQERGVCVCVCLCVCVCVCWGCVLGVGGGSQHTRSLVLLLVRILILEFPVAQWLKIWHCHCYGIGCLVPDLGTPACHGGD